MRFYKNMKIRNKLLASFLAVAMLSIIVGGVGVIGILTINNNEDTLYRQGMMGVTSISGMYAVVVEQRLEIRGMVINYDDEQAARDNMAKLREREDEFNGHYDDYLLTIDSENSEDRALLKKAMDIYNGPLKTLKEQMITSFESENKAEFMNAFWQIAEVAEQATDILYEMVAYNNQHAQEMNEQDGRMANSLVWISAVLTFLLTAVSIFFGLFNAKVIAKPLSDMAQAAQALSMGDVEIRSAVDSKDEIGTLADAFGSMIDGIGEQARVLGAVARGDYTVSLPIRSDKDVINQSIQELINSGNHMIAEMQTASGQVTTGSEQISQGAQGLASGTTEQAASIQQLSHSIAQLKDQLSENFERSRKALANADSAGKLMDESMRSMDSMLEAMASIDESSQSITRIIKVIDDIAFQTNILALNAAVEAARAGQHGKGFAVVAEEVRNLASKSAMAAKETAALIESSANRVKEGSEIVHRTSDSLQKVDATSSENAQIINEMTTSLEIQSKAIDGINQGIDQVAIVIQANAATAEQSASAAEEMSGQAAMLNQIAAQFKLKKANDDFENLMLLDY